MKIALLSDIHANLPALKAVLSDMESQDIDMIYCLGDLVGYAPWPNEVVEEIRKRNIPTIAGNYDYGVGRNSNDCGCAYRTEDDKKRGEQSINYTNEIITEENRTYLKGLPSHIRLEFGSPGDQYSMLFVHGSPRKINEYLFEDRPDKSFIKILEQADAHLLAFGHTHKPYHKTIQTAEEYRHVINIGSVGKPKDADPRACYGLISWGDLDWTEPGTVEVELIRVEYEVEKSAAKVEESPLPNAFAEMLRRAY